MPNIEDFPGDFAGYNRAVVDGSWLEFDHMRTASGRIVALDWHERADHPCIGPERADLVVPGCAILEAICRVWPVGRRRGPQIARNTDDTIRWQPQAPDAPCRRVRTCDMAWITASRRDRVVRDARSNSRCSLKCKGVSSAVGAWSLRQQAGGRSSRLA
jgi:hypothetical protein